MAVSEHVDVAKKSSSKPAIRIYAKSDSNYQQYFVDVLKIIKNI